MVPVVALRAAPALLAALGLLAGCATRPVAPPGPGAAPDVERLSQWTARGRLALSAAGDGGSGSFVWQQRSERTELAVRGPLGAGGLQIVTDGRSLELADASGASIDGEAARAALERRLGTRLPLAELRYWMLGLPAPDGDAVEREPPEVAGFTQGGWVVRYEAFREAGGWSLPVRLTATTSEARVRIVVDDWQVPVGP